MIPVPLACSRRLRASGPWSSADGLHAKLRLGATLNGLSPCALPHREEACRLVAATAGHRSGGCALGSSDGFAAPRTVQRVSPWGRLRLVIRSFRLSASKLPRTLGRV